MACAAPTFAGGLLTNTNQNVAFNRMMSREASIGIDGVYYNPAGVVFMSEGHHLSLNWQLAYQTRNIENGYALFTNNVNNPTTPRYIEGKAFAPVIPSLQYAYNKGKWSFQANFALTGGGGKCTFDNGLGSFEKIVAETALGACQLAGIVDGVANQYGVPAVFSSDQRFGTEGKYSYESYMHGRQYYYGLSIGAAYTVSKNFSAFVGLRTVYASCNYYGYVENIKVGNMPLYQVLDPTKEDAANIELSCDQTGLGFTPIIGIDYKTGRWNFSAKYEFKTRMRLKNKSANSESARNLEILDRWADGESVPEDSPALLTLGARWSVIPQLRLNAGWHHYFDKDAHQYNHHEKKLGGDTNEYLFGAEYDLSKVVEVSAGVQKTNYKMTGNYMEDVSFVVNSYSFGFGVGVHLNKKMTLNLAYFQTNYSDFSTESNNYNDLSNLTGKIVSGVATALGQDEATANAAASQVKNMLTTPVTEDGKSMLYGKNTFTRTNHVFGLGLNIEF